jgi:hypothetical protein
MRSVWVSVLTLHVAALVSAQDRVVPEYRVKAFLLSNFSSATALEWPAGAFTGPDAPFVVGVLGADPFKDELEAAYRGFKAQGRDVKILRTSELADLKTCHMVFVPSAESKRSAEVLDAVRGRPVIVVGESPGFAASGGMLNFFTEEGRLRFELNRDALARTGVSARAQFLRLARIVKDGK